MTEWVLILTLHLVSQPGEIRDISPVILDGFKSRENCQEAAGKLSSQLILLAGKAREQQGIAKGTSKSGPAIWHECVQIQK